MRKPLIRRYWSILLFANPGPGWSVTYRVNWKLAPRFGFLTPALIEWNTQ